MSTLFLAVLAVSTLQFLKGFFSARGFSRRKMAALGFCLSTTALLLVGLVVAFTEGPDGLIRRLDFTGVTLSAAMVLVFTLTYALDGGGDSAHR
ncbi:MULTISPECIES: hypothetical protein [Microbulbifer]|uniref:hypothetical protein n=1 Tax=Microbulbifer TaxID=48073 RepID=UPI001F26F8B8|nr:hypothetical protein [Microbulbifer zhoushanensis]